MRGSPAHNGSPFLPIAGGNKTLVSLLARAERPVLAKRFQMGKKASPGRPRALAPYTDTIIAWIYANLICYTDRSRFRQSSSKLLKHLVLLHPEVKVSRQTVWREVEWLKSRMGFLMSPPERPAATDTDGLQRDIPGARFTDQGDDHAW